MFVSQSGLGTTGYTGSSSADNLREIPSWCSWVPFLPSCAPYTQAELDRLTRQQAEYAANSPSSNIPLEEREEYIRRAEDAGLEAQSAAERSDPYGTCVYQASQTNSLGLSLLGERAYCNADGSSTGFNLAYVGLGLGALLIILLVRR